MKKEYQIAKEEKKVVLPVTINSMFKSQDFKAVQIIEPIKSDLNKQNFHKFNKFFPRLIQKRKYFSIDSIEFKLINSFELFSETDLCYFEMISNEETLLHLTENFLPNNHGLTNIKIINIKSGNVVSEIAIDIESTFVCCWVHHLNQILVIILDSKKSYLMDRAGNIVRELTDFNIDFTCCICYNKLSKRTIITTKINGNLNLIEFDENFNKITYNKKIDYSSFHIINGHVCQYDQSQIYFYDSSLTLQVTVNHPFGNSIKNFDSGNKIQIIADGTKNSKYAYVLLQDSNIVHVLDTNLFLFVRKINFEISIRKILIVYNEMIILQDGDVNIYTYKIHLKRKIFENSINSEYICKFNPLNPHLYSNPYILPCGHSACLDCIYDNYNLHLRKLNCDFDECHENHVLSDKLVKKNFNLSESIEKNNEELICSMIKFGNSICRNEEEGSILFIYFNII